MIRLDLNQRFYESNIYLKWLTINLNGRVYRRYKLDYRMEAGSVILDTIHEYFPDDKNILPEELDIYCFCEECPAGKVDMAAHYASFLQDDDITDLPVNRKNLSGGLWSPYLIDFTGIGSSGFAGHYHHDWFHNRAILFFDSVDQDLLMTVVILLIRYCKSLYHLMTEINLYKAAFLQEKTGEDEVPEDFIAKPVV